MFAAHLRRVYRSCDKIIIRGIRNRRLGPKTGPNPGLDHRLRAFEEDGFQIKTEEAEEILEKSESEFYNVGESYKDHMSEAHLNKEQLRHHLVKDKYFKDSMPNLLTWSEKEQIRHLATTEPDEWTAEKISESFPVTVPVVKKLLKYPWKPATEERIARHDASAMRNWKELKEGTLDIPDPLREHFLKFSNRTIPPLSKKSVKIDLTQQEKIGEFEKIIQRCAAKDSSNKRTDDTNVALVKANTSKNKQNTTQIKDPKFVTLDELTSKIKKRLERGSEVGINDKIMIDTMQTTKNETLSNVDVTKEINLVTASAKESSLSEYSESKKDPMDVMKYPERIRIPKKAYKQGATYKVDDCYYDHDGKFLYRVLGMTN